MSDRTDLATYKATNIEALDTNITIEDDVTPTKILKWQLANLPIGTTTIDVATLGSGGLTVKTAARLATITTLPTYTYSNGTLGVGATLTATATGTLTIDSVLTALNNYILVKDETAGNAPYNGLYKVTTAGAAGVAYVLTRSTDNDQTGEFVSALVSVSAGSTNANTSWVCNNASAPTVGTTDISFIAYVSGSAIHNNGIGLQGGASTERYHSTAAQNTVLSNTSGTNTGDNATNTQYSGLAASKADIASPTFTGTVGGITAAMVGAPSGSGSSTGTNTGDQTSIVGITGTIAQFNTACTDADFATGGGTATGTNTGDNTVATALTGTPSITVATATTTGDVELGHASDTTLSRSAAGVLAVENVVIPSISSTNTLTNKRVNPRITTATNYTTSTTINSDTNDQYIITAQAGALLFNNPIGTPVDGQKLLIAVTGTAARALTWDTAFEASTISLPLTTVTTARLNIGFIYRSDTSKWVCVATC